MTRDFFLPSSSSSNLSPLELPDCVHLSQACTCGILRVRICMGDGCPFLQSRAQARNADERHDSRLDSLDEATQNRISAVYYGGKTPWKRAYNKKR